MKINAVRAMLVASLIIILLYVLGLFLPIIKNTKDSKIENYYKNEYLGTTTWDECADYLNNNLKFNSKVFCLRENQSYDIKNQKQLEKYEKIDLNEMKNYIQSIKDKKYDYENDEMPDVSKLIDEIKIASNKMLESLVITKYRIIAAV